MARWDIEKLQQNILKIMREEGVPSKNQLALKIGMNPVAVYRMFRKDWNPRFSTLQEICRALNRDLPDLFRK